MSGGSDFDPMSREAPGEKCTLGGLLTQTHTQTISPGGVQYVNYCTISPGGVQYVNYCTISPGGVQYVNYCTINAEAWGTVV